MGHTALTHEDFAWPYWGMVRDLRSAIKEGCNYLVALGLLVYTVVIGRRILTLRGNTKPGREESFYCFYTEYMGQSRDAGEKIYEHFRHGAAHIYGFLAAEQSIVAMDPSPDALPPDGSGLLKLPDGRTVPVAVKGPIVLDGGKIKLFYPNAYFRDFQRGLVKAASEYPGEFRAPTHERA